MLYMSNEWRNRLHELVERPAVLCACKLRMRSVETYPDAQSLAVTPDVFA